MRSSQLDLLEVLPKTDETRNGLQRLPSKHLEYGA